MAFVNNTMIIRRDLLTRIAELFNQDKLEEEIDLVPYEIGRRAHQDRCCIHKVRAVSKYKMMGILGFDVESEEDERRKLADYAHEVMGCDVLPEKILTVVEEACTSCVKSNYVVTNLCKGCIAQSCKMNCPREAVTRSDNGQAIIDPKKCVSCGICQKLCPYHAIVFLPVPCEESCPVGAIRKNEKGKETIDASKCILCGKCVNACPFGSIMESTQMLKVMQALKSSDKVIAIVAPALFGQYKALPETIKGAVKELGFDEVVEVAEGAVETARAEYQELQHKLAEGLPFMTSSCCPAWTEAVEIHAPDLKKYVSDTPSPMAFTAKRCRENYPDHKIVFIGPCIAKRREGMRNPDVDYVMTFEELGCMLTGWKITVDNCEDYGSVNAETGSARGFAMIGGVARSLNEINGVEVGTYLVNGLDKKQIRLLKTFASKKQAPAPFIEVMSCPGGCICGPGSHEFPAEAQKTLTEMLKM
jgi:[FeFe] hydrogenase (group B1/B3)